MADNGILSRKRPLGEDGDIREDAFFRKFVGTFNLQLLPRIAKPMRSKLLMLATSEEWQSTQEMLDLVREYDIVHPRPYFGTRLGFNIESGTFDLTTTIHSNGCLNMTVKEICDAVPARVPFEPLWLTHKTIAPLRSALADNRAHLRHLMGFKYMSHAISIDYVGVLCAFEESYEDLLKEVYDSVTEDMDVGAEIMNFESFKEDVKANRAAIRLNTICFTPLMGALQHVMMFLLTLGETGLIKHIIMRYPLNVYVSSTCVRAEHIFLRSNMIKYCKDKEVIEFVLNECGIFEMGNNRYDNGEDFAAFLRHVMFAPIVGEELKGKIGIVCAHYSKFVHIVVREVGLALIHKGVVDNNVADVVDMLMAFACDGDEEESLYAHGALVKIFMKMMSEISMAYPYNYKSDEATQAELDELRYNVPTYLRHFHSLVERRYEMAYGTDRMSSVVRKVNKKFGEQMPYVFGKLYEVATKKKRMFYCSEELTNLVNAHILRIDCGITIFKMLETLYTFDLRADYLKACPCLSKDIDNGQEEICLPSILFTNFNGDEKFYVKNVIIRMVSGLFLSVFRKYMEGPSKFIYMGLYWYERLNKLRDHFKSNKFPYPRVGVSAYHAYMAGSSDTIYLINESNKLYELVDLLCLTAHMKILSFKVFDVMMAIISRIKVLVGEDTSKLMEFSHRFNVEGHIPILELIKVSYRGNELAQAIAASPLANI